MNIVITNDAQNIAGGENYVLYLAEGLREKGHNIYIAPLINSQLAKASNDSGFSVLEVPYAHGGREFKAVKVLYDQIKQKKIDVIHSNSNFDRTIAAAAGKFAGAINFATIHSCMSISQNITHKFRNKYLIDRFTPVGFSTKKIMIEKDKIPEDKISVVHIGLPENKFLFSNEERSRIRSEFGLDESHLLIGTVSRLVEFKGHTYLIKAFKKLSEIFNHLRLLIVGEGELKEHLQKEAAVLGISDKIIFTGNRNDISGILSALDIYTQTSKDFGGETFPVSILEAMSVGLSLVVSDVGDIRYMTESGNGFLTEPENIDQIIDSMKPLIESKKLRSDFGKASRRIFLEKFTLQKMVDNIERLYFFEMEKRRSYNN
ncbi:MAG: hypothetical protein A2V93_06840 [Ignavibacteria bacterium RBG_16_34_14]|nr:MAG: hypothetical protein A2V93_06840 [Ignavibacteria bacterium RBG_16_34_14]